MEITWANLFVFFLSRNINNKCNYYSFKIFLRFWLANIPRIIHNNQLLSMTSIVQQNCQIIEQVNRENLGTRLGYFGSEYKMVEQSFHSFHEEEVRVIKQWFNSAFVSSESSVILLPFGEFPLDSLARGGFTSLHMQDSLAKNCLPAY